ncbi:hypothetical protein DYB28_007273 [Aphanomyces astaci]|uniref:Uncharacterized protein n=1 Tax=Aphanomyces astaci TaxID=112090 RepID=A0A9X8DV34_APHAT|nr:hypothetical protein DYB28_007273 [Aphanomyces astaci]
MKFANFHRPGERKAAVVSDQDDQIPFLSSKHPAVEFANDLPDDVRVDTVSISKPECLVGEFYDYVKRENNAIVVLLVPSGAKGAFEVHTNDLSVSHGISCRKFCALNAVSRSAISTWLDQRAKLAATRRNARRITLSGQGAKCIIQFQHDLLTCMKDVRRDDHTLHMKNRYNDWLLQCQANKPDPYNSLLRLCQSFAHRHHFFQRVACHSKLPAADMIQIRDDFASKFWGKYGVHNLHDIIKVDETAV